jgi:preprotein translocase subunit SecG
MYVHGVRNIVQKVMWSILIYFLGITLLLFNITERGDSEFLCGTEILQIGVGTAEKKTF